MTEPVRAEKHGVVVTKTVDAETDGDVRVRLTIESEWSKSIRVRVRDPVPSAGPVGIPGDEREHWDVSDDEVTFERVLDPEATVETAYDVAVDDPDLAIDGLRTQPDVGVASAPASVTETHPHVRGGCVSTFCGPDPRAVRSATTDRDGDAATDGPSADGTADDTARSGPSETGKPDTRNLFESLDGFSMPEDDDAETAAVLDEEIDAAELDEAAPDVEAGANDARSTDDEADGDVDRKLADETGADEWHLASSDVQPEALAVLEARSVDQLADEVVDEYLEWICSEGTDAEPERASLEVRVGYLQSQFQDLAAYIDAMEAFIDEHGTGRRLLEALRTDMEAAKDRFEEIQAAQTALETRLETVENSLETLQSRAETREEAVDDALDELADEVDAVQATQRETEGDVEDLKTFRKKLQDAI